VIGIIQRTFFFATDEAPAYKNKLTPKITNKLNMVANFTYLSLFITPGLLHFLFTLSGLGNKTLKINFHAEGQIRPIAGCTLVFGP
jgi:hypothetical protein